MPQRAADGNGVPTGVRQVNSRQADTQHIYNLNGLRVTRPTKGVYVTNGRKVIF
jgi:hypothetical protein